MNDPNVELSEYSNDFEHVRQLEYIEVRERRRRRAGAEAEASVDSPVPQALYGVALSGGGIRSASFCLGALQALHSKGLAERIDYLSTVSGGGYTGASMISAMQQNGGRFPFASGNASDRHDNEPISHLRDNSRFLAPNGMADLLISAAVILRGLLVNFLLVLAVVLPIATILIAANPTKAHLEHSVVLDLIGYWMPQPWRQAPRFVALVPYISDPFLISKSLAAVFVSLLFFWAVQRAFFEPRERPVPEQASRGAKWGRLLIIALGTAFLLEIQPPILHWAITVLEAQPLTLEGALSDTTVGRGTITGTIGTIAAAIVALAATFQTTLVGWIKKALGAQTLRAKLQALLARTLIYTAGLIVPLAIYALLLLITLWGIRSSICDPVPLEETVVERVCACKVYVFAPASLPVTSSDMLRAVAFLFLVGLISTVLGKFIARTLVGGVIVLAMATLGTILLYWPFSKVLASADFGTWSLMDVVVLTAIVTLVCKYVLFVLFPAEMVVPISPLRRLYVPLLEVVTELKGLTLFIFAWATLLALSSIATRSHDIDGTAQVVLWCFAASSALFWLLGSPFTGNDNGLHRLYRDRLSAAFRLTQPGNALLLLSKLSCNSPYLLVNATLNASVIDDHEDENPKSDPDTIGKPDPAKRGRNADFFLFSRLFTGSSSTGYATTAEMENVEPRLDLATAVAISGAAVSSSMGRIKIGLLGATLALLNLKLGFWLTNPKLFDPVYAFGKDRLNAWSDRLRLYLFAEVRGQLRVNSAKVYVTDGGHIDNLGVYQLLKRRCKYIVVIDGEADPGMTFSAFSDLQRFARIDEGVRVILNWMPIRDAALARMADRTKRPAEDEAANDQHFAIGEILYEAKDGAIDKGLLVYVKASMTGDEPDYVLDYERRYPLFPHESTGDQFFSEEQMEAYRALGYHCVMRALTSGGKTSGPLRYGGTGGNAIGAMIRELQATATTD